MTPTDYALLAVAVVLLALLIVGWGKLVQQERQQQSRSRVTPEPRFTYHHGRTYDYAKGVSAKSKAKLLAKRRRKELDGKVIEMAAHRRRA